MLFTELVSFALEEHALEFSTIDNSHLMTALRKVLGSDFTAQFSDQNL